MPSTVEARHYAKEMQWKLTLLAGSCHELNFPRIKISTRAVYCQLRFSSIFITYLRDFLPSPEWHACRVEQSAHYAHRHDSLLYFSGH